MSVSFQPESKDMQDEMNQNREKENNPIFISFPYQYKDSEEKEWQENSVICN